MASRRANTKQVIYAALHNTDNLEGHSGRYVRQEPQYWLTRPQHTPWPYDIPRNPLVAYLE